jgi:hypothetical protein
LRQVVDKGLQQKLEVVRDVCDRGGIKAASIIWVLPKSAHDPTLSSTFTVQARVLSIASTRELSVKWAPCQIAASPEKSHN